MTDREQLYEAFDNGIIGLDDIIDISQKDGYNQALEDFADEMLSVCAEYDSYILEIKNKLTK